ncbi:small subunit ribosomal protein S7e [Nematocida major]|uniref:small subunit ribosomal protein S7e n=1 Tax=Nematocida major TaxID=1912982 RepID=UPI002008A74C|nr:small subunit ribosomal protein S7e [Nematocida major]KAH9385484.1 small subunit ribosomal protein S7e [Nematocida major]
MSFKREESSAVIKDNKEVVEVIKKTIGSSDITEEAYNNTEVRVLEKNGVLITIVFVPEDMFRAIKKEKLSIIENVEEALGGTVFVVRGRVIEEVEGRGGKSVIRSSVSYADYQELVAEDLVSPSHLVDRRTVVREDGSRVEKMITDSKCKKDMANRFEPMSLVFEDMFGKKAVFQANYY